VPSTFGDDRSLTNAILRTQAVLYAPDAKARTEVPEGFKKFLRQQLRWKKSWLRENGRACAFMWRKNPITALSFYMGFVLPLLAPLVIARVFLTRPVIDGSTPLWYGAGIFVMAVIFGLFYRLHHRDGVWLYGIAFSVFYVFFLVWQLPYAVLTMRDNSWGTR
jgi:hyaluronan synthase